MRPMTARQIAGAVGGTLHGAGQITAVSTDSRSIPAGSLFVPLRGERFDGHAYIPQALSAGAAGCLCEALPAELSPNKFYIQVPDTRLALKALAAWYRQQFAIPFVQITGSVGKTTTKEMVAAVLSQRYRVLATRGNFNNDIGVPLTLFGLERAHQAAVIESGMNHFGEIRYLGEMIRPDIAVITNIGDAHIEYLGSREGILQAKCEIFENLRPETGLAVLNGDDVLLQALRLPFDTVLCGLGEHCGVRVGDVVDRGVQGITCTVTTERGTYPLEIPALGVHMVYPAAMAVAIGEKLGLTAEEIRRGVAAYQPAGSRMRILRCTQGRILLDDCYNANPQSVEAALRVLAKEDHTVAVLGDMNELGELSERAHREIGSLAKELGIGALVAVGEKARAMAEGAAGMETHWFPDTAQAMDTIRGLFQPGAVLLVKASHAMHFESIVEGLQSL